MKNLRPSMTGAGLSLLFLPLLLVSCKKKEEILSGKNGHYWDVVYIGNKYWNTPIQGYFFRPDGQHYAYHYYGEGRTPFDIDLADTSTPPTIEANLRPWRFLSDTSIQIGRRKYTIDYLKEDTISLKTGVSKNPTIKLARVK
jgi:hypothetical protein